MGIVRYDAFEDMGEISFAVALLDTGNNGFILNCIHSRNENRTYLKPITGGVNLFTNYLMRKRKH